MSKLRNNYYFIAFGELAQYCTKEACLLHEIITGFNANHLKQEIGKMHKIEHEADNAAHDIVLRLIREFITPIEREDIIAICQKIDNVTDAIEDVVLRFYMYNVQELRPDLVDFALLLIETCKAMEEALKEFPNFRKSLKLNERIIEVNNHEEKADVLYTEAVRKLFEQTKDPVSLTVWEEIYLRLENCFDACEDVANAIEAVIMKNI